MSDNSSLVWPDTSSVEASSLPGAQRAASRRKQRILYVVNSARYFYAHWLARASAARAAGYVVHLAAPWDVYGEVTAAPIDGVHPLPLTRRGAYPHVESRTIASLHRLYRRIRPDLIHHITIKPVIYGGLLTRFRSQTAVVNTLPGLGYVFLDTGMGAALIRSGVEAAYRIALSRKNSRTIFENPDDLAEFCERGIVRQSSAMVIKGAGVDMDEYQPVPEPSGTPLVILASRLLWDKGVGEFVEAAQFLQRSGVRARFALVGDTDPGNPAAIPTRQLQQWRDEGGIEWWGFRDDMPRVLSMAHVVCLPSYREGLPRVLIEAAACGRPIVTTDTPGCREIGRDGENGFLVPPRDSQALANALRTLVENPALRQTMGERGRAIAEQEFSSEKVIGETLSVYHDALARKSA